MHLALSETGQGVNLLPNPSRTLILNTGYIFLILGTNYWDFSVVVKPCRAVASCAPALNHLVPSLHASVTRCIAVLVLSNV